MPKVSASVKDGAEPAADEVEATECGGERLEAFPCPVEGRYDQRSPEKDNAQDGVQRRPCYVSTSERNPVSQTAAPFARIIVSRFVRYHLSKSPARRWPGGVARLLEDSRDPDPTMARRRRLACLQDLGTRGLSDDRARRTF